MSITANTIKYQLRRARASRIIRFWESTEHVDDEGVDSPCVEPADHDTTQTLAVFYSVLDTLNARDRTLFGFRFLEGMRLTEVARTMGISVSTTKRHAARIWNLVACRVRNEPSLASDRRGQ